MSRTVKWIFRNWEIAMMLRSLMTTGFNYGQTMFPIVGRGGETGALAVGDEILVRESGVIFGDGTFRYCMGLDNSQHPTVGYTGVPCMVRMEQSSYDERGGPSSWVPNYRANSEMARFSLEVLEVSTLNHASGGGEGPLLMSLANSVPPAPVGRDFLPVTIGGRDGSREGGEGAMNALKATCAALGVSPWYRRTPPLMRQDTNAFAALEEIHTPGHNEWLLTRGARTVFDARDFLAYVVRAKLLIPGADYQPGVGEAERIGGDRERIHHAAQLYYGERHEFIS